MWEKEIQLKDGAKVLLRPELVTDLEMLWEMFSTLSQESLRFLPNPFTRERIEGWVNNIDYNRVLPIVAIVREPSGRERIVASATLRFHQDEASRHKTGFGITVHDDYQNRGLGTIMTQYMIEIAHRKGLKKVYLLVTTDNERAIHVYNKCGFKIEGRLKKEHYTNGEYGDDYRMAIIL